MNNENQNYRIQRGNTIIYVRGSKILLMTVLALSNPKPTAALESKSGLVYQVHIN